MKADMSLVPMVFEAAADAPLGTGRVSYTGVHADPNVKLKSAFEVRSDFVYSAPGQSLYTYRNEPESAREIKPCLGSPDEPTAEPGNLCVYRAPLLAEEPTVPGSSRLSRHATRPGSLPSPSDPPLPV